jgi:hypothetical protein
LAQGCDRLVVLDANRFLPNLETASVRYVAVGAPRVIP